MKLLQRAENSDSFLGHSLLIFLIRFFPSLANILVVIFFSQNLPEETYGSYQNFWVQLYVISTIACLGLPSLVITYAKDVIAAMLRQMKVVQYVFLLLWVVATAGVFAFLQFDYVGALLPLLFMIAYAVSMIAESILIVFHKFRGLVSLNFLYTAAFCLLHWMYLQGSFDLQILFQWLLYITIGKLIVFLVIVLATYSRISPNTSYVLKDVRSLWLHIGFFEVLQRVFTWVDKFILGLILTKELFATYFNGTIEIPFLPLLIGAVGSAVLMQMASSGNSDKQSIDVLKRSAQVLSTVAFPAFFFFFAYRYELFSVLLSDKYIDAVPIFLATIMVIPLRAYNFTTVLQNRHEGAVINKGAILDMVIALALMYPLYLIMGLPGVALSFVISSYIQGAYYLYHTSRVLQTSIVAIIPLKDWVTKILIFGLLTVGAHYILQVYFTQQIILILGGVLTMILISAAIAVELKKSRNNYGDAVSQK